jgi:hypothetical protein
MKCLIYSLVIFAMVAVVGCMNENPVVTGTENSRPEMIPPEPKTVPFFAHEENTILCGAATPDCQPGPDGIAHVIFPGVIEGDHIGSGTIYTLSQVDFSCLPDSLCQTGQGVITAANGDELLWEFEGRGDFVGPGPGDVAFSGNFWFVPGGTGRFAGATGGGTYNGTADTIAGFGQFDLDGVISR